MKHSFLSAAIIAASLCTSCNLAENEVFIDESNHVTVPFEGNVYVTGAKGDLFQEAEATIDQKSGSIKSWCQKSTTLSFFVRTKEAGQLSLRVVAGNVGDTKSSTLSFTDCNDTYSITVNSSVADTFDVGTFNVERAGYTRINITGSKTSPSGAQFPRISSFIISGSALKEGGSWYPYGEDEENYWCRRGPSVHVNYTLPGEDIEWFYNEAVIPEGFDIADTYFMLTGFGEGYMGIQTHSDSPNTVLFSVWSPQKTDDPSSVKEENRVTALRRGTGVTVKDFGGEGSGGQSFMEWPWVAGKVYKTLVHVTPDGFGDTDYTGYFCDENGKWHLLASFRRPNTVTWYTRAHSFLECFNPVTSIYTREVRFSNQWARTAKGEWKPVNEAKFTCDNTGRRNLRGDFYGATKGNSFVLRNGGFFDDQTEYGTMFSVDAPTEAPEIDFDALENL